MTFNSLQELCDWLNEVEAENIDLDEYCKEKGIDLYDLPCFGGKEIKDTLDIYSWDEDNILVPNDDGDPNLEPWFIIPRYTADQ